MLNRAEIEQAASAVGFDACGVARAGALTDSEYPLRAWLAKGWHGGLDYMERNVDKRMESAAAAAWGQERYMLRERLSAAGDDGGRGGLRTHTRVS